MNQLIVTAIGTDRPGIVSELTSIINSHGGNVEESRMSRLGSDFAIIMLISFLDSWENSLELTLHNIDDLTIFTKKTSAQNIENSNVNYKEYNLILNGADNEGIIKVLSKYLAKKSINILDLQTHISQAPTSGSPLFNLKAKISMPLTVEKDIIKLDLQDISQMLGVEINLNSL